ncbi:MAG TPA: ABC transporter ATP-binding protein [Desulfitobacteriaceae bacterium]|nr:ABC transporter ATP-binding protein [Desulfitobacteriaceae bacterium]
MLKLFKYLRPFAISVAVVLVLIFLQSLVELYLPTLMADIVDRGIVPGDTNYILRIGGFMLIIAAGSAVCSILAGYMSSKIATGYSKNLRSSVFSRVQSYSLHEFNKLGTASLITRTTNDITQIQQLLIFLMRITISAPMMFIGGIIMAVSKDAALSLVFVVVLPLLTGTVYITAGKSIPLFRAMQIKLDNLNRVFREGLSGIRVIRAFNRVAYEKKRFSASNLDLTETAIKVNILLAALMPVMMLVMNFTTLAIVWFGGIRISHGNMLVGDMMAFIQYAILIMFSLVMVSFMFIMIPRAEASAIRINEVLEIVPEISDAEAVKSTDSNRGLIEFKNVTFCYPGAEYPALKDISFVARPGEITAIIGGTGSGKSTLINLIPRFYDIDSGHVLVNGLDVREMAQKDLRAKIGFVPQKTMLFTGTVADNIRLGKEDATDEEVRHAAAIAQATEFISDMPNGFASLIAQGGINISGGQKQRLSIARALVRKPEIYIFDDSFSALDYKTDARLRAALRKETADATVIVVGQRVSTVLDADQIIVMDKGQIVGLGKHKDLMQTSAIYQEIVSSQLSEEEIA